MTVSAAEKFTTVTEDGFALGWSGESNLEYGNSGSAVSNTSTLWQDDTKALVFSVPNFITALDEGTEFVSLKVAVGMVPTGSWSYAAQLTTGTSKAGSVSGGITNLDGDETYWGLSGSPQDIFSALKSGALKFRITFFGSGEGNYMTVTNVTAQLTYRLADTKRAALILSV